MVTSHAFSLYIRILQDFSRLAQIISNYIYSYIIGFNSLDNSPEAGLYIHVQTRKKLCMKFDKGNNASIEKCSLINFWEDNYKSNSGSISGPLILKFLKNSSNVMDL